MSEIDKKNIIIYVSHDRILTYKKKRSLHVDKGLMPVYTVNSVCEAEDLISLVGFTELVRKHSSHPYRLLKRIRMGYKMYLEDDDLMGVTQKLDRAYQKLHPRKIFA